MFQCMRVSCTGEAGYSVKATVPPHNYKQTQCSPVEVYCGLRLCETCANQLRPRDILTPELKETVILMMHTQHHAKPDFLNSQIQIISCDDLQLLMLEAKYETIH